VAYIQTTKDMVMTATIGDDIHNVILQTFVDSDYAGDQTTLKSTSGGWLELSGPSTRFVIDFVSKRQAVVRRSSTEAEVVAADTVIRRNTLPLATLLEMIQDVPPLSSTFSVFEDNQAALINLMGSGPSKELRHLNRTHKISLRFLQDVCKLNNVLVSYLASEMNSADPFTKAFTDVLKWRNCLELISMKMADKPT